MWQKLRVKCVFLVFGFYSEEHYFIFFYTMDLEETKSKARGSKNRFRDKLRTAIFLRIHSYLYLGFLVILVIFIIHSFGAAESYLTFYNFVFMNYMRVLLCKKLVLPVYPINISKQLKYFNFDP
jgi:hypothetical protein